MAGDESTTIERLPERVETERLVIRLWRASDVSAMDDAVRANVDHLRPWMPWVANEPLEPKARLELITTWYDEWQKGNDATYGIFLASADADPDGSVPIGGTGLHRRIGPGGLEIGYWIHVDHVRRGYASEAAAGLTAVGLRQPGIDRIEIRHDNGNVASAGVPRALGYELIGEIQRQIEAPAETGLTSIWQIRRDH